MRVAIRVKPGASRARVGGAYGAGEDARLIVAVTAKAVDGKATEAALAAVAEALGVRRRSVRLVTGVTSRDKVVEVDADEPGAQAQAGLDARVRALLAQD